MRLYCGRVQVGVCPPFRCQPEHCEPQEPLSFDSVKVWRLEAGEVVSLAAGPGDDYYRVHIRDGQIMEDPY